MKPRRFDSEAEAKRWDADCENPKGQFRAIHLSLFWYLSEPATGKLLCEDGQTRTYSLQFQPHRD